MHVVYLSLVLLSTVSAEYGTYHQNYKTSLRGSATSRDINEEQELDHLLEDLMKSKEKGTEPARLYCYTCASTESWESCENNQTLVSCPADTSHCITAAITLNDNDNQPVTEYYKSCVRQRKCNSLHYPVCQKSANCEIECCDVGKCNEKRDGHNKRSFTFNCKPPCLLYATLHQINAIELASSRKEPVLKSLAHVTPVDVDMATKTLYWSDKTKHVIKGTNLVSGVTEVVISGDSGWYEGIAVDWANRMLYWTDRVHKRIEVVGLDDRSRKVLLDKNVAKPRAIIVDPRDGYIFWTDWSESSPRIERASLSGSHRKVLVSTNIRWPNGLVLDYTSRKLYFCDSHFHRVESINYDGSDRRVLYSDDKILPFDLALYNTTLFWSDWSSRSIEKIDITNAKRLGSFGSLTVDRIAGVAVMDDSRQPQVTAKTTTTKQPSTAPTTMKTTEKTTVKTLTSSTQTTALPTTIETTTPPTTESRTTKPTTQRPTKEATTSSVGLKIRLAGGAMSSEGRVEVLYNGQWGTICDDYWDLRDAFVVCRMLGYPGAISEYRGGFFGNGQGPIWLDSVNCVGHESSLEDCSHRGWGVNDCRHSEDAGVKCRPINTQEPEMPLRLVNGRGPHEGRVEVYFQGQWGTVCDDLWSKENADVICRMLGYPASIKATIEASYGSGSGPIWLDNVRCRGHEMSIKECSHQGWGSSNCQHSEDAGVVCQPKTTLPPSPTTPAPPGPLQGFAIICLPRSMYIRMSIIQLQQMLSHDFDPVSLHLNDPSCGVIKADNAHVVLGTPLNGCGTERRHIGSSLTFTNKVAVDSSYAKRVASRTSPFEFPFRCSYMRTNRKRMFAPPRIQNGRVGQW